MNMVPPEKDISLRVKFKEPENPAPDFGPIG
jgi:hypothetical protein